MKKTICTVLAFMCSVSMFSACKNSDNAEIERLRAENESLRAQQTAETNIEETTTTRAERTTTAKAPAGDWDATYKDCYVKLNGATMVEKSNGDLVAVIEITFRNESEETRSCGLTFAIDAYQDGIECDQTILFGEIGDEFDTGTDVTDVKPGVELTVYKAYKMRNDTSDVVVEVRGLYDFDKNVLFEMTYRI